jgi:hypothetical protein
MSSKPTLTWHTTYQDGQEAMNGAKSCRLHLTYNSGNPDWVGRKEFEISTKLFAHPLKLHLTSLPENQEDGDLSMDTLKLFLDNVDVESWDSSTDTILTQLLKDCLGKKWSGSSTDDHPIAETSTLSDFDTTKISLY